MGFSYPEFMGQILYTMLRKGGYSGYGYEYAFEDSESYAGGRSRDFSEGRGPRYTDEKGFDGRSPEQICAGWVAAITDYLLEMLDEEPTPVPHEESLAIPDFPDVAFTPTAAQSS